MKPIVCFYRSNDARERALFDDPEYERSYKLIATFIHEYGGEFRMVKGLEYFLGAGNFSKGWSWDGKDWQPTTEGFHADIVYNNVMAFEGDGETHLVNDRRFHEKCMKDVTMALFPDLFPKGFIVHSKEELAEKIGGLSGKLVTKPTRSYGGKGVLIGDAVMIERETDQFPSIIQEFIDASEGIPGLTDGMHDLRILTIGGKISDCYLRNPAAGKELANVMQGGSIKQIPLDTIPAAALAIAERIDAAFADFPDRVYSADLGLVNGKDWYLFELNSPPGLPTDEDGGDCVPYLRALCAHLIARC